MVNTVFYFLLNMSITASLVGSKNLYGNKIENRLRSLRA